MASWKLLTILFLIYPIVSKVLSPTISNSSGDYYITSLSNPSNFSNDIVICKSFNCFVICDLQKGCYNITINSTISSTLTLSCLNHSSCYKSQLIEGPINTANIYCTNYSSCELSNFNMNSTPIVNIECNSPNNEYGSLYACVDVKCYMENSINATVLCNGNDCSQTEFYVNYTENTFVTFQGYHSSDYGTYIYGTSITKSLAVACNDDYSCRGAYIYCPHDVDCNITCNNSKYHESCQYISLYIPDRNYRYLNVSCNNSTCDHVNYLAISCVDNGRFTEYGYDTTNNEWKCYDYGCCPFNVGNITCPSNEDCFIDCSNDTCVNSNINGLQANTLTLNCSNPYSCAGSIIECPYIDNTSCNIYCYNDTACSYIIVNVNANITNILNVTCVGKSTCQYMILNATFRNIIYSMNLLCKNDSACSNSFIHNMLIYDEFNMLCTDSCIWKIYLSLTSDATANILCDGSESCAMANFYVNSYNHSGDKHGKVTVVCNSQRDCYSALFNFTGVDAYVDCVGPYSCLEVSFFAYNANLLNVHCRNNQSCATSWINCPYLSLESCTFMCSNSTDACNSLRVNAANNYMYGYLNITCPIPDPHNSCEKIEFNCYGVAGDFSFDKQKTYYNYNNMTNKYECKSNGVNYCCPWFYGPNITCNQNQNCTVYCSSLNNCAKSQINGTDSNALNVICNDTNSCQKTSIICPIGGECNINCYGESCNYTVINYYGIGDKNDYGSVINLNCDTINSWNGKTIVIYAPYISSLNITNGIGEIYAEYVNDINIYGTNHARWYNVYVEYANTVNVICEGEFGCHYFRITATYTKSVSITAMGNLSWYDGSINALNADSVNVTCSSKKHEYACYRGTWLIPPSSTFNCYGSGCYYHNSFWIWTNITNVKFNMNGCSQCNSGEHCTSTFTIYCNLYYDFSNNIEFGNTDTYNTSLLDYCSSNNCGCTTFLNQIEKNFTNNHHLRICPPFSASNNNNLWIWIGIIGGSVLFILIIVGTWIFIKKKRETNESETYKEIIN